MTRQVTDNDAHFAPGTRHRLDLMQVAGDDRGSAGNVR
jgi:hypothetical protein